MPTKLYLKELPGSKQWARASLQDKTFTMLNTFRDRVNTNSIRYNYDIYANNNKTATHKASVRVDLCVGTNNATGHNGVLFPHAQISFVERAGNNQNVSVTGLNAYQLRDGEVESEVRDMINHVECPNGVLLWIYSELQTLSEFGGVQIRLQQTRGRYVATRDNLKKVDIPDGIMTDKWAGKQIKLN
jgi:hypothetical protein